MLVLDYIRRTDPKRGDDDTSGRKADQRLAIQVPHFHAGHLGFLPGTRVYVGLTRPEKPDSLPELLVTPINASGASLVAVSATFGEDRGVVRDFLKLFADDDNKRNYNIEVQESSSLYSLQEHRVDVILRLPPNAPPRRPRTSVVRRFEAWRGHVPTDDPRCLELFVAIVARFGDKLHWSSVNGERVLDLSIRHLPDTDIEESETTVLEPSGDRKSVLIPLPESLIQRLDDRIDADDRDDEGRMYYVYGSDTEARHIRVAFISARRAQKLMHVGFTHRDRPAELHKLMDVVEGAGFNIVTSLLRKHARESSVWEALLEGQKGKLADAPDFDDPSKAYEEIVLPWVRRELERAAAGKGGKDAPKVSVGPPLYPAKFRPKTAAGKPRAARSIFSDYKPIVWSPPQKPEPDPAPRDLTDTLNGDRAQVELRDAVRYYSARTDPAARPRLFCSWSLDDVSDRAVKRITELEPYEIVQSNPRSDIPLAKQIADCDYFLGIWEQHRFADAQRLFPPWLSWEYAIAASAGIACCLVLSSDLEVVARARIDPGTHTIRSGEAGLSDDLLNEVISYCRLNFT